MNETAEKELTQEELLAQAEDAPIDELGDPAGDFNVEPPPVPEGQNYIVDLGLGRKGISRFAWLDKVDGSPRSAYKADVLAKFVSSEDGDTDLAFFASYASVKGSDGQDLSSFVPKGKTLSGILHVAGLLGLSPQDFSTTKEFCEAIEKALRAEKKVQALATRVQWQWSMSGDFKTKKGDPLKYKTVAYGMTKSAEKREDGTYDPTLYFMPDGTKVAKGTKGAEAVTARAVVLELQKLA